MNKEAWADFRESRTSDKSSSSPLIYHKGSNTGVYPSGKSNLSSGGGNFVKKYEYYDNPRYSDIPMYITAKDYGGGNVALFDPDLGDSGYLGTISAGEFSRVFELE